MADGRPAPTEKRSLRRRRPTLGAKAPLEADFNRREEASNEFDLGGAFGRRSACADRKGVFCVGGGRRLGAERLRRPISIGGKRRRMNSTLGGLWPTVGLCRPKNVPCVGGGRRVARRALEGRFQSAREHVV